MYKNEETGRHTVLKIIICNHHYNTEHTGDDALSQIGGVKKFMRILGIHSRQFI